MTIGQEHPGLQHDGIFYDDESSFSNAAVSFVREGIERDEVVMVNTGSNPVTSLLRALFADEEQVLFGSRSIYTSPTTALDRYRRAMSRGLTIGVRGFRAVGFVDFDASGLPWQEWLRYEAAVNHVFGGYPFRTLCPYDTTVMDGNAVDALASAHTGLVDASGRRPNPGYVEPAALITDEALRTPPHSLQSMTPRMVVKSSNDDDDLRVELYAATMFTHLPRVRVDDFVSAVSEVVRNAHLHGVEPVTLKLWASDTAVVCTVTDRGSGIDDPLVGYARPRHPAQGIGLWGARQLVDVLDFEWSGVGFTVRLASFT